MERPEAIYSEMISLRITPELKRELDVLATKDMRPLANYVRVILEQHVSAQRDQAFRLAENGSGA
jgi:predicted DNA-binding protein